MHRSALAGGHATNHLRSISQRLFGMECTRRAGHALRDDLGVFIDEDAHKRLLKFWVALSSATGRWPYTPPAIL